MSQLVTQKHPKKVHSPTLATIRMVEETLKHSDESLLSIAQLKKELPKQVNHTTLMEILRYLEESNKIYCSLKGITWTHNPKLSKIIEELGDEHQWSSVFKGSPR